MSQGVSEASLDDVSFGSGRTFPDEAENPPASLAEAIERKYVQFVSWV